MSGLPSKGPPFETYMPTYSSIQRRRCVSDIWDPSHVKK